MLLNPFTFHAPTTLAEAVSLYSRLEGARIHAGGTFLVGNLKSLKKKGAKTPAHIISLRKIQELRGIVDEGNTLTIKAMTTIRDLWDSPLLTGNTSVLKTAARNISTTPIRNMATIGGNLTCRYTWTELPAIMVGLDADLHFIGPGEAAEKISAEDFFKNEARTDKILTHATIVKDAEALISYQRIKKSPNLDIPLLSLLMRAHIRGKKFTNVRVSINNTVTFARRDQVLEGFLNNAACAQETLARALDHLDVRIYDTRSSDYKKHMFRVSLQAALQEMIQRSGHP